MDARSPEVASVFETATVGFDPVSSHEWHDNMAGGVHSQGLPEVGFIGTVNSKWRLYRNTEMDQNLILIGCNDRKEPYNHYARIKISNFII